MYRIEEIADLSPDEVGMLLVIVNDIFPTPFIKPVDAHFLKMMRRDYLKQAVTFAKPKVKEEYHDIYASLLEKVSRP